MSEIHASDQKLITELQGLLDQVAKVRSGLISKNFAPSSNGCVCEGTALCSHHAGVYDRLEQAADNLALAIREAGRVE
jgi:hypothetical protein